MPRKKDPTSLTQSYAAFLKAHPEPFGDPGKLFGYMLFACPPNAGVRFCYADETTMLKAMGWRSLDQVDAAVKYLQSRRFLSDRVTATRSVGDEMEGYYLYPKGDAPPPQAFTPPPGLFGEAITSADPGEQEEEPSEQPDSLEVVWGALRRLTASVDGVLHLEDFKNLVRSDAAVRHLPPEEVEHRIERDLTPGSWNIREYGNEPFMVAPSYVGDDFMTTYEFNKLADKALRVRPRA
jgi:hypothetical protein